EYYVGDDGAMLINTWKKTLADEDMDDPEDDGEAWYYFGSKGKKTTDESKKINGKTYFFNEDGKMRDGWYQDGEDVYYLGEEDDGARTSGWLWLEVPEEEDVTVNGHSDDEDICDEEGWYYFGSNGKMYKDAKKKKVNGKYYFFNEHGQMLYEWINGAKVTAGSNAQLDGNAATPGAAEAGHMIYTNVVEEGWRADGWYEIDGAEDTGANNDTDWYYFKDGEAKRAKNSKNGLNDGGSEVYRERIKINGKYFCFNEIGQMQTGLQYIEGNTYYFDENGYMKTGKVANVEEENDSFTYYFQTKNGGNGKGVTGEKDGYLYWNGKRLEADDDYRVYKVEGNYYLVNNKGKIQKSKTKKYDVENTGAEDVIFAFSGNKIDVANSSDDAQKEIAAFDVPEIELIDSIITTTGEAKEVHIDDAK
ncbi:glucan-binding protein, partial [[Clostridium] symbiosum]